MKHERPFRRRAHIENAPMCGMRNSINGVVGALYVGAREIKALIMVVNNNVAAADFAKRNNHAGNTMKGILRYNWLANESRKALPT